MSFWYVAHATPSGIIGWNDVECCRQNIQNLEVVDIGSGVHFLQEDNPRLIEKKFEDWRTCLRDVSTGRYIQIEFPDCMVQ
ncbi:hypothetical protein [Ruegeria sp. HKCCA0370]|uniref:hypothetical protein n=1 Tax=Ruegeria sp. HKCCA0370 TaxID=2682995 RepID=UPI001488BDA9|nr:hypothetical protein [Ruegeria sp. HKCCA0370]